MHTQWRNRGTLSYWDWYLDQAMSMSEQPLHLVSLPCPWHIWDTEAEACIARHACLTGPSLFWLQGSDAGKFATICRVAGLDH